MYRSSLSAVGRRRIAEITMTSVVLLAACGSGGGGDSFSSGRACRNVERLIEAVQAGDPSTAGQELDRLTDDVEVESRMDGAELDDVVDDPDGDTVDAIEDAVSGLNCDLDIEDVDITDPTTDPPVTDPTTDPTRDPTVTDPTTDPTMTDPTTDSTGDPPFTLPQAPTTSTVPPTDPTTPRPPVTTASTPRSTDPPNSDPPRSDPTAAPTTGRRGRVPLITVDVGAIESADVGEYDKRDIEELTELFGIEGLMVPAGPNAVDLVYVAQDFGDNPSRYDDFGFQFASKLSEREVLARFRDAVSGQGDYTFENRNIAGTIGFDTEPADIDDQIPNWDVAVSPKDGQVHRVEIVRSDHNDDVRTRMRDIIADRRKAELELLDDLGWDVSGFSYYSSTAASSTPYETSDLTFVTSDAIVKAKDRLVGALGGGAKASKEDDFFNIETPEGVWFLSPDYGAGVTGRFTGR